MTRSFCRPFPTMASAETRPAALGDFGEQHQGSGERWVSWAASGLGSRETGDLRPVPGPPDPLVRSAIRAC
jgi:hypothetical protein